MQLVSALFALGACGSATATRRGWQSSRAVQTALPPEGLTADRLPTPELKGALTVRSLRVASSDGNSQLFLGPAGEPVRWRLHAGRPLQVIVAVEPGMASTFAGSSTRLKASSQLRLM
mmetsp:Transcript_83888/g.195159  ORF Transcript_83888/g.195159 Transcript_83888/m.195159 type:complete len:118 (+) Transcript_83888:74-427(+)